MTRLRRLVGGAALGLVALAIAAGAYLVCGEVVFEANDEIGLANVLTASVSARYVLPAACAVAMAAVAVAIGLEVRARPPRHRRAL